MRKLAVGVSIAALCLGSAALAGWDGNGNVVRTDGVRTGPTIFQDQADLGIPIQADLMDVHAQDLADAIEVCLAKDGQNAMTGDLDMGSNDIASAGAITASGAISGQSLTLSSTATGILLSVVSTEAGSSGAPTVSLNRNSASPADNDNLAELQWNGRDDGGNFTTYGRISGDLLDTTDTTEDGELDFNVIADGTNTRVMSLNATGILDRNEAIVEALKTSQHAALTPTGAAAEFSAIQDDATRITIVFTGVSHDGGGSETMELVLGDSGGYETSGYIFSLMTLANAAAVAGTGSATEDDYDVTSAEAGTAGFTGTITMERLQGANTWVIRSQSISATLGKLSTGGGSKSTSAVLDRLELIWSGGANFDAGSVSIAVE